MGERDIHQDKGHRCGAKQTVQGGRDAEIQRQRVTDKHRQRMMYIHILRGFQNEKGVDRGGTGMMGCW